MKQLKDQTGFTLLEVLLSVGVISLIAGIGIPIYQTFQNRNDLDIASTTIAQTLRRAQILSQAVEGDISWGLRLQNDSVTLFKGTSFAVRDSSVDEVTQISASIMPSSLTEVVFTKFTGLPQTIGSFILSSVNNETRTITLNAKGTVAY